jgi:AbrB family looped-hinge helix DNA binding protein
MDIVTVSPKFQVVIPLRVRQSLDLQPGQKVHVLLFENRIELIPVVPIQSTRGIFRGIDTEIERESDRV